MASASGDSLSQRVRGPSEVNVRELECGICQDLFWKPVACEHCETPFCSACIELWLAQNPNICPMKCEAFVKRKCPRFVALQLAKLHITCVYCSNGCQEVLAYEALEKHEMECDYHLQQCSGCGAKVLKKDFAKHQDNCELIEVTCSECNLTYKKHDASSVHTENICLSEKARQLEQQTTTQPQQHSNAIGQLVTNMRKLLLSPLHSTDIPHNATWTPNGVTVAGGNGQGKGSNELYGPQGLFVDDDQTVLIADSNNYRIMEWKCGVTSGQVIVGENGAGNRNDQLKRPTDVFVDKETDCLFICDEINRRVVRWPLRDGTSGETIISDVCPSGLTMDDNGFLYISHCENHDVRRWRVGEKCGTVVAGGNGKGNRLDQLNWPKNIFVDRDHAVYVSDEHNHRVMKWVEDATEGIVVAGGRGYGNGLTQLNCPRGVVVDQLGTVYVADCGNHRIMRWSKGATQGSILVGGNGQGEQPNQLYHPMNLSFDRHGNLYVADYGNDRVQRFNINRS